MRQARRSVKDKVRDLKRVLKDGVDAIYEQVLEPITAMIILPGNGRDADEPADAWVVNGQTMTHDELNSLRLERGMHIVERVSESTKTVTQTRTVERFVDVQPKIEPEPQKKPKKRLSTKRQEIAVEPSARTGKPAAKKFDIDLFMENAIDAEEIAKFNYEVGQRLIRPIRWR